MLKQRNRSATVFFALLPGAGHMFMGFMKRGVSFMALFFLTIFLSSWLSIGPLMYLLPVLWFYSFFDCINLTWATAEEFAQAKDSYLFQDAMLPRFSSRWALYGGVLLVFFGVYMIFERLLSSFEMQLNKRVFAAFYSTLSVFPQFFFGIIIIIIGIRLILGKKKELKDRV